MIAWIRSAMARSESSISAIFASTSRSPSALALFVRVPRRASAFNSRARSFIAARSSAVNPPDSPPAGAALVRQGSHGLGLNAGEAARPHARDHRLAFDPAARSLVPWGTPGPRPAALSPTAGTMHRFAFPIALALLLSSSDRAAAQSLRGSKASLARQVRQAELHDYTFLRRPADVERFV